MSNVEIREMSKADEYFVSTCTHVNESREADECGKKRLAWFKKMRKKGFRAFAALLDGKPAGFIYLMPIEVCPWGPLGTGLISVPCLYVLKKAQGNSIGRALFNAAENEARRQGKRGLVTVAYHHDFWFMPASFFEKMGFKKVDSRDARLLDENHFPTKVALMWKTFSKCEKPRFAERKYRFKPVKGKVVIDLFSNAFCSTSTIEAQRVRDVAGEFEGRVVLNEHWGEDRSVLESFGLARGIFINGKEAGWGYEAPKSGLRKAIKNALNGRA